jgi:hypothetical protein
VVNDLRLFGVAMGSPASTSSHPRQKASTSSHPRPEGALPGAAIYAGVDCLVMPPDRVVQYFNTVLAVAAYVPNRLWG